MIPENEIDRYRVISHTRYLFKLGYSKEYLVDNVRYNYGENCLFLPDALEEYDRLVVEQRRKDILAEITAATAQGMIDEMVASSAIDLPTEYTITGTDNGRVIFKSTSPKWSINTPLNYLKARLTRRFPKR